MTLRLYLPDAASAAEGQEIELPPGAVRHAQVRRVQPGDDLRVFDGVGGCDRAARMLAMGRHGARVRLGASRAAPAAELPQRITLAFAMPANERMDFLVEKATELGAAALQPLTSERSVLRLAGERAARRRDHWQAVAAAACEQCGRAVVPVVAPVLDLAAWLAATDDAAPAPAASLRLVLSLQPDAQPVRARTAACAAAGAIVALSGPEGGLTPAEEDAARRRGFVPTTLGSSVLRADTAPLALLAWLALSRPAGAAG